MSTVPTLIYEVGFGTAGSTEPASWTDISAYVRSGQIARGVSRYDGVYARAEAGTASLVLSNLDARFDPTYTSSPYYVSGATQVLPMVQFRIRTSGGYSLWRGFADSWTLSYPNHGSDAICTLSGTDGTKVLANIDILPVSPAVGDSEYAGARIGRILDAAGWPAALRVLASGATTLQPTAFGSKAWDEILLSADTDLGEVAFDGQGRVVFRGRQDVIMDARSNTSQATFGDAGAELRYDDLTIVYDDTQIRNEIHIGCVGGAVIWVTDDVSIVDYLLRTFERTDLIHEGDEQSLDYANYVLALLARPELRLDSLRIVPQYDPTTLNPQVLGRDLGDRITVKIRPQGRLSDPIVRDAFIRGISHSFTPGTWQTTWALQDASRFAIFVFDHAVLGRFDYSFFSF